MIVQRVGVASVVAVAVLMSAVALTHAQSSAPGPKRVLSLYRYARDYSDNVAKDQALQAAARASGGAFEYFVESLDLDRLPDAGQFDAMAQYLRRKYGRDGIDILISNTQDVSEFLLRNLDIFPDAAMVTYGLDAPDREGRVPKGGLTGVVVRGAYTDTLNLALRLHPNTRNAFVVIDTTGPGDWLDRVVRQETRVLQPRLNVEYLTNLPLGELIAQVKQLPTDSVILYVRQAQNEPGRVLIPRDILPLVSQSASVPTYGITAAYQGFGVVGGYVFTAEDAGRMLGDIVLRIVNGTHANDIPITTVSGTPTFDWRQLERWGISESQLSAGSEILFRQPGVWELYRAYILSGALIVIVQSALIAGLLVQGARRRRVEIALRDSEQRFRESAEQNQNLAGRLINAQEVERTRIARDLHDDLSQQLAGLGIMLSGLRRKIGKLDAEPDIDQAVATIQDRTSSLAQSVRNLSHELHPSVLQHAGLVATLRSHCAGVEEHHRVTVTFSGDDHLDSLRPEVSLCLFRVVQEALTNAARHARARTIRVQLMSNDEDVELSVIDDGIGFAASERSGSGLGLRSIDERVRLARGTVTLESRPGQGTTLQVRIPIAAAQAELT